MQVQGLPHPRAGSEYDDLHAYGADRYAPTDLRAFAARVDHITASEYEDEHPRAGSAYDDLHAHGADRYAPTDLRAFAARVDLITASEYEDELRAYGAGHYVPTAPTDLRAFAAQLHLITGSEYENALRACANMDDLRACVAMMDPFISQMDDKDKARDSELLCVQADMNEALEL